MKAKKKKNILIIIAILIIFIVLSISCYLCFFTENGLIPLFAPNKETIPEHAEEIETDCFEEEIDDTLFIGNQPAVMYGDTKIYTLEGIYAGNNLTEATVSSYIWQKLPTLVTYDCKNIIIDLWF